MTLSYWEKREKAKNEIARALRTNLLDQYKGLPVIVLRNRADTIRQDNKQLVKNILLKNECDDFPVTWQVFFDFRDGGNGVAVVFDFIVIVEGT